MYKVKDAIYLPNRPFIIVQKNYSQIERIMFCGVNTLNEIGLYGIVAVFHVYPKMYAKPDISVRLLETHDGSGIPYRALD